MVAYRHFELSTCWLSIWLIHGHSAPKASYQTGESAETLKAPRSNGMDMTWIPPRVPIQWGNQKVLEEEVRWRLGPKHSWGRVLFWALAIVAFVVVLYILG